MLLLKCLLCLLPISCEDVIDVETFPDDPRLIVNGIVRVDLTEEFVPVEIRVTETSDFFGEPTITQLDEAVILIGESDPDDPFNQNFGTSVLVETEPGSGIYIPSYIPGTDTDDRIRTEFLTPNTVFFLIVEHKGKRYLGQTNFVPTVPIDNLAQGDETLFDDDDTEVKVTFTDVPDEENYYVFDFGFGEFLAIEDQFIDGQTFEFSFFYEDLDPGSVAEVSILGANRQFFNYIDLLVEQTTDNGGVFQTPATTPRGNMFDVTGLDNIEIFDNTGNPQEFALGYFAVVQEFKQQITIE